MQKKLIALAIAGAFAAPAFAASSNVDIAGYMNFSLDYLDADAAGNGSNLNVSSNSSNIVFKGSEDLGGGMKAIWQIQTYFSAGGTGNDDSSATGDGSDVGAGTTFVGLSSGFGTVALGKLEAPYKVVGRKYDFFGNQLGDSRALVNQGLDLRPNNTVAYISPNLSGFAVQAAYATNPGDSGVTDDTSIDAWTANATYDNGPISVGLGYIKVNRSEDNPAKHDESAWRLGASYTMGDFKVAALYQQQDDKGGTAGNDVDVWGVGASYKLGAATLKAQYYTADDLGSSANTGADMWAAGVDYALSKRTMIYGVYASVDNDSCATYTFGGGHGDNPATACGGNPAGFSLGVVHSF